MVHLAQGDLPGARRVLAGAPAGADQTSVDVTMGVFWDLGWVLDEGGQRRLLAATPSDFDGDRAAWSWTLGQMHALRGDAVRAREYAEISRTAHEQRLRDVPDDSQARASYALVLASLGRASDALREGEKAAALMPLARDAYAGAYIQHQFARLFIVLGQPERALDLLEPLLRMPYYLSPAWLRIDPTFAPLRMNARFVRLLNTPPLVIDERSG